MNNQVKTFRADYIVDGKPETIIAEVRHDDRCGNGHNTFSITGTIYSTRRHAGEATVQHESGHKLWADVCGCIHDEIAKRLPELAPYIKWHSCSTKGPLHYLGNTIHLAGDRDCWGLLKGEFQPFTDKETGLPKWRLADVPSAFNRTITAAEKPDPVTLEWEPWGRTGEGKERELDAARRAAIWPEATDAELTAPDLRERLEARLPALLAEFQAAVESLGFIYLA